MDDSRQTLAYAARELLADIAAEEAALAAAGQQALLCFFAGLCGSPWLAVRKPWTAAIHSWLCRSWRCCNAGVEMQLPAVHDWALRFLPQHLPPLPHSRAPLSHNHCAGAPPTQPARLGCFVIHNKQREKLAQLPEGVPQIVGQVRWARWACFATCCSRLALRAAC